MNTEPEVDPNDYENYTGTALLGDNGGPSIGLADLAILAQEQLDAEAAVAAAQAALTRAQERLKDVQERRLPEAMEKVGMETFKTSTGLTITVSETVRASPPKEKRPEAYAWLRANEAAALLKRKVTVEFGKGEDDKAKDLASRLVGEFPTSTSDETTVHPQTLAAWVKKRLEEGKEIPLETLGVHKQKVAKIAVPK